MKNPHSKSLFFGAILVAGLLLATPASASRPGGGGEGPPSCTVMGKVVRVDAEKRSALVMLLEIAGSATYDSCQVTGAQAMAEKKTEVNVMVDSSVPAPVIGQGDIAFVDVKAGGALSFSTFFQSTEQLDQLLQEVQIYFDNKLERLKWLYAIKSFIGTPLTIEALVQRLDPDNKDQERRLGAALMLIILAQDKQTVPPDAMQTALRIGLMESRQTSVGSSIKFFPADPYQIVNQLSVMLRDKESVRDPFATIVALGEMGSVSTRALGDVVDRMNDSSMGQIRDKKEEAGIFRTAVEKMGGQDDAARYFMKRVLNNELKDPEGPLADGMCALKGDSAMMVKVAEWCKSARKPAVSACEDALSSFDRFIAAKSNACVKDDDCEAFPPAQGTCSSSVAMAKKLRDDDSIKEGLAKFQAMIQVNCAGKEEAECKPAKASAVCRNDICVLQPGK